MFRDREDAGQQLLERLSALELDNLVILALPRGGLPVADVIAEGLDASLDIVLVRKVGCPGHRELAVGAVTNGSDPLLTVNEEVALALGLDHERIRALAEPELETIRQRRQLYLKGRPSVPLAGKTVVVVDDGIATGATMRAALSRIRQAKPARLLAAVPVASPKALRPSRATATTSSASTRLAGSKQLACTTRSLIKSRMPRSWPSSNATQSGAPGL